MAYKIPDDITAKVKTLSDNTNKNKKYENLYNKLDKINSKFDTSNDKIDVPNNVSLERLEFNKPSSEEIKKQSETLLNDYKNSGLNNIENTYKQKYDELNTSKTNAITQTDETKQKLSNYYANAKNNAEIQASNRGLNRSSIIVNQLNAFTQNEIDDYKALDEKLGDQINAINFELNALNSQKENAVNNFNIAYAVKLQEKITELNNDLAKKEQEVQKYNNEIALKEAEFNKDVDELRKKIEDDNYNKSVDLVNLYGKYGSGVVEKVKQDELVRVAKQFILSLSNSEREELLADETFKNKMGANYTKLLKELG